MGGLAIVAVVILLLGRSALIAAGEGIRAFFVAYGNATPAGRLVLTLVVMIVVGLVAHSFRTSSQQHEASQRCRQMCDDTFNLDPDSYAWRRCLDGCSR